MRAGTEGLPQIAAMGIAAELAYRNQKRYIESMSSCKKKIVSDINSRIIDAKIIESDSPHIISVSFPGYRSEVIMNFLESKDIFVSRSSACKKGARSHVLEAMGLAPEIIDGTIRISLSRDTTENDCTILVDALHEATVSLAHK